MKDRAYNRCSHGFVLMELLVVVSIVGILAAVAIPAYSDYTIRAQVSEAAFMVQPIREDIEDYYAYRGEFPADNAALGLPEPAWLKGAYVDAIAIVGGAIHVRLRATYIKDNNTTLSFQPGISSTHLGAPLIWLCGNNRHDELGISHSIIAVGENTTDIAKRYLPSQCRG